MYLSYLMSAIFGRMSRGRASNLRGIAGWYLLENASALRLENQTVPRHQPFYSVFRANKLSIYREEWEAGAFHKMTRNSLFDIGTLKHSIRAWPRNFLKIHESAAALHFVRNWALYWLIITGINHACIYNYSAAQAIFWSIVLQSTPDYSSIFIKGVAIWQGIDNLLHESAFKWMSAVFGIHEKPLLK